MFHLYTADGSKTEVIAVERAAPHSTSPTHAAETHNSMKKHVLKDLERNKVPLTGTHFAASGTFVDPLNTSGMMEPKCYNKEAFLKEVVEREPGVTIQDKVTKGRGGHPRTSLLLVDSVLHPATFSKTRQNAEDWGIPVMSYACFLATYYCLRK